MARRTRVQIQYNQRVYFADDKFFEVEFINEKTLRLVEWATEDEINTIEFIFESTPKSILREIDRVHGMLVKFPE